MKIILYIFLFLFLIVVLFFVWGFMFYLKVPSLDLQPNIDNIKKNQVIDDWFRLLEQKKKFNGAVLISKDTTPLLMKGYGFTSNEKNIRINEKSSFQLASISKQYTAVAIMLLVEQKKFQFDDKVTKFIPDFPYPDVTIRHLLNQTSGIPDVYMELAEKFKSEIKVLTNQKVIEILIREKPINTAKPNDEYSYSNTNYVILAYLIEKISNQSHEEFMKSNIFDPMGMKHTRLWNLVSKDTTFDTKTEELKRSKKGFNKLIPSFLDGVSGDGAIYSSVSDMVIWDKFWYKNSLVSEVTLDEAFKKPILNDGTVSDYGFGWIIEKDGIWHNGSWLGANTYIWRNPKTKTFVVILDNASSVFIESIISEIQKNLDKI